MLPKRYFQLCIRAVGSEPAGLVEEQGRAVGFLTFSPKELE